jgi:AcrR family transcriptional regulator
MTTPSRRDRRISARQTQILEAAAKVFAQKGFRHATIRDVAQAADVADGTIYNYFENKEALLNAIINQLATGEQEPLLVKAGALTDLVLERIKRLHKQYDMVMAVLPEILETPELRERYYRQFVQPVATTLERELSTLMAQSGADSMDVQLAARVLLSAVLGFQVLMILGDPLAHAAWDNPDEMAKVWSKFIAYGLR